MTPQEFIETAPLYTRVEITDFSPPNSITRMCDVCKKETTWYRISELQSNTIETGPQITYHVTGYTDLAKTYNVPEEEIQKLLNAKRETRYEDKMKIAANLIPEAVKPAGVNPLGQLYKYTSVGLH